MCVGVVCVSVEGLWVCGCRKACRVCGCGCRRLVGREDFEGL